MVHPHSGFLLKIVAEFADTISLDRRFHIISARARRPRWCCYYVSRVCATSYEKNKVFKDVGRNFRYGGVDFAREWFVSRKLCRLVDSGPISCAGRVVESAAGKQVRG